MAIGTNVDIKQDSVIQPNAQLGGTTKIGERCTIESFVKIDLTQLDNDVTVRSFSYIEHSVLKDGVIAGPYAHIRPECVLENGAHVAHAEVKASRIGARTKIRHWAFVGDADIGEGCNIGAGAIFANWDGQDHQKITVGKNSFIGVDAKLIAPLTLAEQTGVAAGAIVTKDVRELHTLIVGINLQHPHYVFRTPHGWKGFKKKKT